VWDNLAAFATIWMDLRTTIQSLNNSTMEKDEDHYHNMLEKNSSMMDKGYNKMGKG
jgi:hypothetical protein